jgi:SP family arabinose:H+ symporter-like MFS transporter
MLLKLLGAAGTFWIYAGCSAAAFVFVLLRFRETKGRTLEEIELSWRKS